MHRNSPKTDSSITRRSYRTQVLRLAQCLAIVVVCHLNSCTTGFAADNLFKVTMTGKNAEQQTVEGRIVVEAADGGIMLQTRAGHLHSITPKVEIAREDTGKPYLPYTADEMATELLQQFGDGFHIHQTDNYVICTNTSETYSKWCGILFERLAAGFLRQWEKSDLNLHQPKSPLVAIIFRSQQQFSEFATQDEGPELAAAQGYYSIRSNRMVMFDLTSADRTAVTSGSDIARRLAMKPANVSTVVHEATHQIAFNTGLHTRYADNPLWLTEGMAMYFETPDLRSPKGWKTAGRINLSRLKIFKDYVSKRRKPDSLTAMLQDNDSFQEPGSIHDAYAEAWAFSYFLMKTYREKYIEYLKLIQAKPRLAWDSKEQRVQDFTTAIGKSPEKLNTEFERYMRRRRR